MTSDVRALPLGSRVVVRWRLDAPDPDTGATLTDTIGELDAVDDTELTVRSRTGPVTIRWDRVVAAKQVPQAPARRRPRKRPEDAAQPRADSPPHLALSPAELQAVMWLSWGAVETEPLGDWRLRASSGFTLRGNSVLPLGDPGMPLREAVARVQDWYAARALPARFALTGPVGFDPTDHPVGSLLAELGYTASRPVLALTAPTAAVAAADPGGPAVHLGAEPGEQWLAAYGRSREVRPGITTTVLTGSPRQLFGHVLPGGGLSQQLGVRPADAAGTIPVATARLGFAAGWVGLGSVWTEPAFRGRGLAAHLVCRLADEASQQGETLMHLQVDSANEPALRLYARLGFTVHSSYAYLAAPDAPAQ